MYAKPNPQEAYRQQGILTANPTELIVMLYDGCIKQLSSAASPLTGKTTKSRTRAFKRRSASSWSSLRA